MGCATVIVWSKRLSGTIVAMPRTVDVHQNDFSLDRGRDFCAAD
jgi:hypothetical protein